MNIKKSKKKELTRKKEGFCCKLRIVILNGYMLVWEGMVMWVFGEICVGKGVSPGEPIAESLQDKC